jgi:hypothetical protein
MNNKRKMKKKKLALIYRRTKPDDSHPISNEVGRDLVVPSQVRVVWAITEPDVGNLHIHMSSELSLLLNHFHNEKWEMRR